MEINGNTTIKTGSIIDFQLPIVGTNHTGDNFDVYQWIIKNSLIRIKIVFQIYKRFKN